ncbi:FkbM family methyltransferase [Roseovarius sp. C7]|uniref:FkbM family methyltransferase n=1 Tax=Roseovarius sp. C7 TaxID=3398643 RepID=UPI0039F44F01
MASLKKWLDRRRNPWKGVFYDAFKRWKQENGPARLYDYKGLPTGAVVLDIGAFRGEWSDLILAAQPDCTIHAFEPHPGFARELREKYAGDTRVIVHECALGSAPGTLRLSDAGDASSSVAAHDRAFEAPIVSVESFFADHPLPRIDLAKINIEGGEYDLLPALVTTGQIAAITRLQVQFHLFEPGLAAARDDIRANLDKTHDCVWAYPFVWEEWQLRRG